MDSIENPINSTEDDEDTSSNIGQDVDRIYLKKQTRRDALQTIARAYVGLAVGGLGVYSMIHPSKKQSYQSVGDKNIDPSPVNSQTNIDAATASSNLFKAHRFEREINGVKHKVLGVAHTRKFAEAHYNEMDELVKHSRYVISEAEPPHMKREDIINDGKAYFGTIFALCKKYNKPVLFNDNLTKLLDFGEGVVGCVALSSLYENVHRNTETRREFVASTIKGLGSTYLFLGTNVGLNARGYIEGDKTYDGRHNALFFNHEIDQRNINITKNIIMTSKAFPQNVSDGDYVFCTYGKAHTKGIEYYLDHPLAFKIKSAIYSATLDLMDSDYLRLYAWNGSDWSAADVILRKG